MLLVAIICIFVPIKFLEEKKYLDSEKVKDNSYFKKLGESGMLKKGDGIQIVFKGLSGNIKMGIEKIIKRFWESSKGIR